MEKKVQLQWKRTKLDGGLEVWVNETGNWVHYKKSQYSQEDAKISSQSGFATFQNYIKLSKQGLFELEIKPVDPEDMNER